MLELLHKANAPLSAVMSLTLTFSLRGTLLLSALYVSAYVKVAQTHSSTSLGSGRVIVSAHYDVGARRKSFVP